MAEGGDADAEAVSIGLEGSAVKKQNCAREFARRRFVPVGSVRTAGCALKARDGAD